MADLDNKRNADLEACSGVNSAECNSLRQEVRNAAAEYIRADRKNPLQWYYQSEKQEAQSLANGAMNGVVWGSAKGAGGALADGVQAIVKATITGLSALFGDTASRQDIKAGSAKVWDYVSNSDNWPYLVGVMTPQEREKLAQAYEKGDGNAVGQLLGAQAFNILSTIPTGGVGATIKIVSSTEKAAKAAELAIKLDEIAAGLKASGKYEEVIRVPAGSKGAWDKAINGELKAKSAYLLDNGHTYVTDSTGRVTRVEGALDLSAMDRNAYQQCVAGKCGIAGDEGGHLIAASLGGAGDKINIVPQAATLNRGDWKVMENYFREQLAAGKQVSVSIEMGYPPSGGVRPSEFRVLANVDGKIVPYRFSQ